MRGRLPNAEPGSGTAYPSLVTLIRDLVLAMPGKKPGSPRLTWYGDGERIDLSGRVLMNGVVKATNLLVAEADVAPGARVTLDLPPHWRTVVWALAAWTAGAEIELVPRSTARGHAGPGPSAHASPGTSGTGDVLVTDRPPAGAAPHQAGVVVAVPLPALAMKFPSPLAGGTIDGAADVMTYPDALGWLPPLEPERPALASGGMPPVTHVDLLTWARSTAGAEAWPGTPRVLLAEPTSLELLAHTVAALAVDGSLVLLDARPDDLGHLVHQERVTVPR